MKDFEVDAAKDPQALVKLARKHNKKHTMQSYPELDHLFKYEPGDSTPPATWCPAARRPEVPRRPRDLAALPVSGPALGPNKP
jgi:hypothetical protein